jgi:NAD(P)-dependent dehydrogenase (short-subunit alcohol dehydrogenase family)
VNCVCPGMVDTGMTNDIRKTLSDEMFAGLVVQYPLGIGTGWDVACGVAYLLAEASRWTTGQTLVIDGGFSAH